MARHLWKDRILADPEIHHGDPCIRGTRIPVAMILGSLADGVSTDDILSEYPQLSGDDIRAALEYAAEVMRHEILIPLAE
jgi:uncharacterized protein (DUF433 family)